MIALARVAWRWVSQGLNPSYEIYEISLSITLNPHPICARSVLAGERIAGLDSPIGLLQLGKHACAVNVSGARFSTCGN